MALGGGGVLWPRLGPFPAGEAEGGLFGGLAKMLFALALMLGLLLSAAGGSAWADAEVLPEAHEKPDPEARYVFYLHGQIIENKGRRPTHPRFGVYEYDAILDALRERGYVVISEKRQPRAVVNDSATRLVEQIQRLLAQKVPADRITVIGFSKGGRIAQRVSAQLKAPVRYVLLASCAKSGRGTPLRGNVLSIREKSDSAVGSCTPLIARSPQLLEHDEILIDVGGGHGAFYRPDKAWMVPLTQWAEAPSVRSS